MTNVFRSLRADLDKSWRLADHKTRQSACKGMIGKNGWEIHEFAWEKGLFLSPPYGSEPPCTESVTLGGRCYKTEEVNYWLWGWANRKCRQEGVKALAWWRPAALEANDPDPDRHAYTYTLPEAIELVTLHRATSFGDEGDLEPRIAWTVAGYYGSATVSSKHALPCGRSSKLYEGTLNASIGGASYPVGYVDISMSDGTIIPGRGE